MTKNRKSKISFAIITMLLVLSLVGLEYGIQLRGNENKANKTSAILINQVEEVMLENEKEETALVASLKEDYITRAKAVAYTLDHDSDLENNLQELRRIAALMSVDEIYLFDESGTIYAGTNPEYKGLNFDSGSQISYFKPMLKNKSLTMCQDVTPNTAEEKSMMYAICWNDDGTRMVQVGITPLRLMKELQDNEISEVVEGMPSYSGVDIIVADAETQVIKGSTEEELLGLSLKETGLTGYEYEHMPDSILYDKGKILDKPAYCAVDNFKNYIIIVAQEKAVVNQSVPLTLLVVLLYLGAAAVVLFVITMRMTNDILEEQKNAVTDPMTNMLNRRGYEEMILRNPEIPPEQDFVYVSMDLNGLKRVNDHFGHAAGDELIRGAAECMKQCLGNYGMPFRIGGDEFAAIIFATEEQIEWIRGDFQATTKKWSATREYDLSVAIGFATKREFPEKTVLQMAEIADARMYQNKENYYKETGVDKRFC